MNLVKEAFRAVAEFFGWARARSDANNAPEIRENAKAAERQEIRTDATDAVAKDDIDAIRRGAAE